MSTAAGWDDPALEPPPREPDPDLEYDLFCDRVDRGVQCYVCRWEGPMRHARALGIALFVCPRCGAEAVDLTNEQPVAA